MKFATKTERLAHPVAALIPEILWDFVYCNNLSDEDAKLMAMPIEDLLTSDLTLTNKLYSWLSLLLSHPQTSREQLLLIAQRWGVSSGHIFFGAMLTDRIDILETMNTNANEIKDQIAQYDYILFKVLSKMRSLERMTKLVVIVKENPFVMLTIKNCEVLIDAATNGHIDVLTWFKETLGTSSSFMRTVINWISGDTVTLEKMLQAEGYRAFRWAAEKGHLEVLNWIKQESTPEELQLMIAAANYDGFRGAAYCKHTAVLNWFKAETPTQLPLMMLASNADAFVQAAETDNRQTILWLEAESSPELLQQMIAAYEYNAFHRAVECNKPWTINWLKEKVTPKTLKKMLKARGVETFCEAASNRNMTVLNWYSEQLSHNELKLLIDANDYRTFTKAANKSHHDVTQFLLTHSWSCYAFAENHGREYASIIRSFTAEKLALIRIQASESTLANPNIVFNITDPEECRFCFYIIRHLIQQNDPTNLDALRFLLEIPSVKALAHQGFQYSTPSNSFRSYEAIMIAMSRRNAESQTNQLLRLALSLGNQDAALLLLSIPEVRSLAAEQNYYSSEQQRGIDVRALANDAESSMIALTKGEQQRLSEAIKRYKPILKNEGAQCLMSKLRTQLETIYQQCPAKIIIDNNEVVLPLSWDSFKKLNLNSFNCEQALRVYYQHKAHSAWRYILKPNPWMAEDAQYVYENPENPSEKWATFESYQPLIAMLWLAATDVDIEICDNHTPEGRLEHFIHELALIARAHNWDKSRCIILENGKNDIEEYDDLEGDKPSCYSGVKRRLLQSVIGHPLLKILTQDTVMQELRDFLRREFSQKINDANREQLASYWNNYITELTLEKEEITAFAALNMTIDHVNQFIQSLLNKYGAQFDSHFSNGLKTQFFAITSKDPTQALHFFKFAGFANLPKLLESPSLEINTIQSISSANSKNDVEEDDLDRNTSRTAMRAP